MTNEELLKNHAGEVLEKLVKEVVAKKAIEIRFEFEDNNQWSVISTHNEDDDKEISIRLHAGDLYELYIGFYDDNDEFFEVTRPVAVEEKNHIPNGMKKLMQKVLADEQGMRVPGSLLAK